MATSSSVPIYGSMTDGTKFQIGISGIATGIGNVWNTISARKVYALYKKQEQAYIDTAFRQAAREQLKGDIALVSLRAEHADLIGQNKLAVAASGGSLSGSFLDKIMQNKQATLMDERAQSLNTLWATTTIKEAGYQNAVATAAKSAAAAYKVRDTAISSFLDFTIESGKSVAADMKQAQADKASYQADVVQQDKINRMWRDFLYGKSSSALDLDESSSLLRISNGLA